MVRSTHNSLSYSVAAQIQLLNQGKPLEAFDTFFDKDVMMYSNGTLFASGAAEGRARQEPFITAATNIDGQILDLTVNIEQDLCVFRNHSTFIDSTGKPHQINGLSWQRWKNGFVIEERYFDGQQMQSLLDQNVLANPSILLTCGPVD